MGNLRVDFNDDFSGAKLDPLSLVRDSIQRFLGESFCPFKPAESGMKSPACRIYQFFVAAIHSVLLSILHIPMVPPDEIGIDLGQARQSRPIHKSGALAGM